MEDTTNETVASLVMLNVYHFLLEIALAKVTLNPEPLIPVPLLAHETPLPLVIWENVKPVTEGATVAAGDAGQVIVPIPV